MLNEDKIKQFWKDGYLIVKNVYSKNEVEAYRNFISKESKKNLGEESVNYKELEQKNLKDVLSYPELQSVILNKKLISTIRDILGDEVAYWGYSSFRWNEKFLCPVVVGSRSLDYKWITERLFKMSLRALQ